MTRSEARNIVPLKQIHAGAIRNAAPRLLNSILNAKRIKTLMLVISIAITVILALIIFLYSAARLSKHTRRVKATRIIDFLQHAQDEKLRLAAIEELGDLDLDIGTARLIEALQDSSPAIREAALDILETSGRDAIRELRGLRRGAQAHPNSLGYAIEIFGWKISLRRKLDNQIVPSLAAVLNVGDSNLREAALAALQEIGTPSALAAIEQATGVGIPESTQLSARYPREMSPNRWEPLIAYVYRPVAKDAVASDARTRLGTSQQTRGTTVGTDVPIPQGAMITATPNLDGFQVNPPQIFFGFYKNWHRLDFEIQAPPGLVGKASNGVLTFTLDGIIIADVPILIHVKAEVTQLETREETSSVYQKVFCSYSHEDLEIVQRVESVCRTLGMEYFRDTYSLRSGENWSKQLLHLIERADIFQLFWSVAASRSEYVEMEWRHALKQSRTNNFIRPVYWSRPMPTPPLELRHIHFFYEPSLSSSGEERHV